ncbi:histidinol dehydrogenase [Candidatus Rhodoluna planktonica]|uniref:Histidinol dehydrogenase n=2 Tax=Candidatus Rhodoluna planktonica TaxID=535712 RepID=A0A1D9E0Y8_9MICO|nr:histidinol dehydrogenase [Candidatus Rhodoluna planktonica]
MMRLLDLRGKTPTEIDINLLVPRASLDISKAVDQILPLLAAVKANGSTELIRVSQERDGIDPRPIRVEKNELHQALQQISPDLRKAIETAIARVRKFSEETKPHSISVQLGKGATVSQRWQPVDSVGLYVPGGKAVYPSSVVMNVVPAQVAGVPRLAIATPGQKEFGGRPHPSVLATAELLGVDEIYCMGGPAAIAAFAYGLPDVPLEPVRMVTGPGNIFVAAAKRALRGTIGIDSEAGTTEILIVADSSSDPRLIAYDLISQAEHDEAAASVLITDSLEIAEAVGRAVTELAPITANSARVLSALNGQQSAIVVVDSLELALDLASEYSTEHLEIHTADDQKSLEKISNAGAIFLGKSSPVSLGDYMAGSNHVLPTGQQAKFGSGLSVFSFLRAQQVIDYNEAALAEVANQVDLFARTEGLPAHGEAILARLNRS